MLYKRSICEVNSLVSTDEKMAPRQRELTRVKHRRVHKCRGSCGNQLDDTDLAKK
ncbi:18705_t:CDS:2 [Acaulospora morrowiae]|uniref:18705_t:CDS:1 n=1 Tax=Acaulospora morrowiae TaxID=94023 RepID=A0A9N9FFM7_9GLOM|nr:18705_t:CDS:2 [Acaulospora morrowiae]